MVCIIYFDVFKLIRFLKLGRYSSKVIKPVNNPDVMYMAFYWLNQSCYALAEISHAMHWVKLAELLCKFYLKRMLASHGLN